MSCTWKVQLVPGSGRRGPGSSGLRVRAALSLSGEKAGGETVWRGCVERLCGEVVCRDSVGR